MKLFQRCLLLLMAVSLLGACSSVRLVYSNLDRAVVWRATDYVDLDRAQRSWLRQEARVYLHWHRYQQLPEWASLIEDFEGGVQEGMDLEQLTAMEERAQDLIAVMLQRMAPLLVDLMAGFSDSQIRGLQAALEASNEDLNADYEGLPVEEQRAVWRQKTRDGLHRWIGRLSPEQETLLASVSASIEPDNSEWVAFRRLWQADLLDALGQREQMDVFEERIVELLLHRERWHTPEYREIISRHQGIYRQFAVDLINNLEPEQKRRLSGRLSGLVRDFEMLASSSRPAPESAGPAPGA
ncbi:MAG: hypothetical protein JJT88_19265 [Gammaproteobacteria bacterium]|nr:hypothetical protein [Gammaproteobacteria bacterium]